MPSKRKPAAPVLGPAVAAITARSDKAVERRAGTVERLALIVLVALIGVTAAAFWKGSEGLVNIVTQAWIILAGNLIAYFVGTTKGSAESKELLARLSGGAR